MPGRPTTAHRPGGLRFVKPALVVLAGLLLGVAAAAADQSMGLGTSDLARVILWIPNTGSVWVAAAYFAGAWVRGPRGATAAGFAVLLSAVLSYYAFGLTVGDRVDVGLAALAPTLIRWLVGALVFGPILGYLGWAGCRKRGVVGLVGALALPAALIVESGYNLLQSLPYFGNDPWRDGLLIVMFGLGLLLAVIFVRRWRRPAPA